ncbi:hypothetical protein NKH77_18975 [Streptomyces sp. M19]
MQTCLSSYVFDYVIRQKIAGTHLTYGYLYQLPVPELSDFADAPGGAKWFIDRVAELAWTSRDLTDFAKDLGYSGMPFRWSDDRRALLRAELDAALFLLYGVGRDDAHYVMETFSVVRREDEAAHGTYRTQDLILDIYDRMAEARETGRAYQTVLDPPPGEGPVTRGEPRSRLRSRSVEAAPPGLGGELSPGGPCERELRAARSWSPVRE